MEVDRIDAAVLAEELTEIYSCTILSMGRCDLVYNDPRPYGDTDSLQSKEALVGRSIVNIDSLYLSHNAS